MFCDLCHPVLSRTVLLVSVLFDSLPLSCSGILIYVHIFYLSLLSCSLSIPSSYRCILSVRQGKQERTSCRKRKQPLNEQGKLHVTISISLFFLYVSWITWSGILTTTTTNKRGREKFACWWRREAAWTDLGFDLQKLCTHHHRLIISTGSTVRVLIRVFLLWIVRDRCMIRSIDDLLLA